MKFSHPHCESCKNRSESIFSKCTVGNVKEMDQNKSCSTYKKGQFVFLESSRPLGLYCLHEGKVKIVKNNSEGKEQILRLARPGDIIGYRALIAGTNYSASAVALEDATICFFPKDYFDHLILSNHGLGNEFIKMLSVVLGSAEERMAKMALKPVRERLAEGLLLLYRTYANKDKSIPFKISILREDLASLVGTTKETAIRFLSEFKDENIVKTQGSSIEIIDLDKLIKISHLYD